MISIKEVNIMRLDHLSELPLPRHGTSGSAGVDLTAAINKEIILFPGDRVVIGTGIAISIPEGFEGQIRPRSGMAVKNGVTVINSPGTIDSDYRGEIKVPLINLGSKNFGITRGMRIAQLVISKYEKIMWNLVTALSNDTLRGSNGFGSTGS